MNVSPATVVPALTPFVNKALVAQAVAEVLREEIDGYAQTLLDANEYTNEHTGERITDAKDDWTMTNEAFVGYHALLDAKIRGAGHNPPPEFCPALMAESAQRDAESELIKAAEPFFKVTQSQLLCGTGKGDGLETHKKFLDLLKGLVVSYNA